MRKTCTFLCGIAAAVLMTGCGAAIPDLTQEETNLISEYAVGVLLKHDKHHCSRLVDTTEYETAKAEELEEIPEELEEQPEQEEASINDTETIDVSQDEEETAVPSTIEEYYGIQDFTFQYTGYEIDQNYPPDASEDNVFFAMDATEGTQLLVLKFIATNNSASDQTLNMLEHGARFRVSVNGESSQGALATMLLNDMQTYDDVVPAGSGVELVSIVEIPQSMSVGTIEFILRGGAENSTLVLQ
ncbi:MAG: hypothetical protein K2J99_16030 [Lachnospiraceae bacterium]|nr:hypothetical protein [Lachnospiraceae bacterium]